VAKAEKPAKIATSQSMSPYSPFIGLSDSASQLILDVDCWGIFHNNPMTMPSSVSTVANMASLADS
jgi:hypothetical protein